VKFSKIPQVSQDFFEFDPDGVELPKPLDVTSVEDALGATSPPVEAYASTEENKN